MDSAAYFILYGNVDGTITLYKQKRNREREVPLILDDFGNLSGWDYPAKPKESAKKKVWPETRWRKMRRIKEAHPGISISDHAVDTDGVFKVDEKQYFVDHTLEPYQPIWVEGEQFFPCDKVIVGKDDEGLHFYSQSLEPIDEFVHELITKAT